MPNMPGKSVAIQDVIPIHTSDTGTFKRCRRRWDYTSPMRKNLRPKVTHAGISFPLVFGTCIHSALQHMYTLQQIGEGGLTPEAAEEYLDKQGSVSPAEKFSEEWTKITDLVTTLNESWSINNADEIAGHLSMGIGMMNFYQEWAVKHDDFEVVNTEHLFSVDTGLRATNKSSGEIIPVHYRGRMDMVVRDRATGRYGILDHKTSSSTSPEEYLEKLDMDEQVTRYVWAAEQEAKASNGLLPYTKIDFVYYNVLWKGCAKPPAITTKGVPSIDKTQFTTYEFFEQAVMATEARQIWFKTNEKAQQYAASLKEQGDSRFVHREQVYRNPHEVANAGQRILLEIQDMLAHDLRIYPNATGEWYCLKCPFRAPCLAAMDGSDVDDMLEFAYEQNMGATGEYSNV